MFCYDDAWLANESLAFYMSTNTFSNPIFVDAQPEPEANVKEPNKEPQRAKQLKQRKSKRDVSEDGWDSFADDRHGGRWWALYDGLAFSVKSKIYVLELNFKRELRRLKRFASDHLPCFMLPNKQRNPLSGAEKWSCWLSSSSCSQNRASFIKDEFWKEVEELSSRKALEKQQEKVLNRLEKVLEAIRSEQQREQSYEQQQQSDGNDQLFNMSEASLSDGVAMQFVGHPIVSHKSIMMSSGLTSLLGSKSPSFCSQLGRQQHKFENGHRAIRVSICWNDVVVVVVRMARVSECSPSTPKRFSANDICSQASSMACQWRRSGGVREANHVRPVARAVRYERAPQSNRLRLPVCTCSACIAPSARIAIYGRHRA